MSGLPSDGGAPQPVTIEVQTPKVDATLDLVQILHSIAGNAQATATSAGKGVVQPLPTDADTHLQAISDLASQLATHLTKVQQEMPTLHAAIEAAAADKPT
jgi:hypothetical protein